MSPPDIFESVRVSEPELEHEDSTSDRMITFLNGKKKKKIKTAEFQDLLDCRS